MLLINELKKLRHSFLNNSSLSLKEKAFYQFLVHEPLSYPTGNNLTKIEQICLAVFSGDFLSKKELIATQRKRQPIHGMHYRKNLIELSAMALDNVELERENLKSYCEECSTRDFYLLNNLFPNILSNIPQPQDPIDQLALHLYNSNFPREGWEPLLLKALHETSDLIDLHLVEQGYQRAMNDSPIVHRVNAILYVRDTCVHFMNKTERRIKLTIGIVSALPLISISGWLGILIIRNWDNAEPIIAVTHIWIVIIGILIVIFGGFIPDKVKFINSFREKIINWVFTRKGFNRLKLKERLDQLANQDEL